MPMQNMTDEENIELFLVANESQQIWMMKVKANNSNAHKASTIQVNQYPGGFAMVAVDDGGGGGGFYILIYLF